MAREVEEKSFSVKLAEGIAKNRKVILIAVLAVLALLIIVGVVSYVQGRNDQKAAEAIENAMSLYEEWNMLSDEDEAKAAKAEELTGQLESIIADSRKGYADMKAHYLLGQYSFLTGDYAQAAASFGACADSYSDIYLAPVARLNEGLSYEMAGDMTSAIDSLQTVVDSYAETSPEAAHALFAIGRIYESEQSGDLATAVYEQLVSEYPSSEWTKLARSRLAAIE